jgi:hypothetical protein
METGFLLKKQYDNGDSDMLRTWYAPFENLCINDDAESIWSWLPLFKAGGRMGNLFLHEEM